MVSIDRGTVPELKSDEFLDLPLLFDELRSNSSLKPPEKVLHIFGAGLGAVWLPICASPFSAVSSTKSVVSR